MADTPPTRSVKISDDAGVTYESDVIRGLQWVSQHRRDYNIKVTPISKGNMGNTNPFGEIPGEKLEVVLDGERLHVFEWDRDRQRGDDSRAQRAPWHRNRRLRRFIVGLQAHAMPVILPPTQV